MSETKKEKFIRLAENRVTNALKQIELIGNLSNKSFYEYDISQIDKIFKALKQSISNSEKNFYDSNDNTFKKFKL